MRDPKDYLLPFRYDQHMESEKWRKEIPFIKFNPEWEVKVCPPFGGAVVRFRIRYKETEVSVYLDCYDSLGCVGSPYWEVYPYDDDVRRVLMNDTDELLETIQSSLNQRLP